ncbi:MAG: hypothetical protein K2N44_12745 [Lachnospiraceae bacterium]|nr:hypothetical protein [Lachnospiraceae bacterium]
MVKNENNDNPIYKIAAEISNNDGSVLEEVSECLSNTEKYFSEHEEEYEERNVTYDDGKEVVQWLGMVDILQKSNYVCERDYKDELEDFLYFMQELKVVKDNHLPLEEDWFDEEEEITDWCGIIDSKWVSQDMCVAAIDIGSDSYVMFICNINVLHKLLQYAEETEYRIACVCDM